MRDVTATTQPANAEPRNPDRTVLLTEGRVYGIEVRFGTGGPRIETLCLSVGDDRTAGIIHRAMNAAYADGLTDVQTRAEVLDALVYEFNNALKSQHRDPAFLADLDRAMGIFEPASTPVRLAELGRHVAEMAGVS